MEVYEKKKILAVTRTKGRIQIFLFVRRRGISTGTVSFRIKWKTLAVITFFSSEKKRRIHRNNSDVFLLLTRCEGTYFTSHPLIISVNVSTAGIDVDNDRIQWHFMPFCSPVDPGHENKASFLRSLTDPSVEFDNIKIQWQCRMFFDVKHHKKMVG